MDTTYTKLFVGGLAWEARVEQLRQHFEQFGELLESVVIFDKDTGKSKGYGFVTYVRPEEAQKALADPYPEIAGRRANCNLAAFGRKQSGGGNFDMMYMGMQGMDMNGMAYNGYGGMFPGVYSQVGFEGMQYWPYGMGGVPQMWPYMQAQQQVPQKPPGWTGEEGDGAQPPQAMWPGGMSGYDPSMGGVPMGWAGQGQDYAGVAPAAPLSNGNASEKQPDAPSVIASHHWPAPGGDTKDPDTNPAEAPAVPAGVWAQRQQRRQQDPAGANGTSPSELATSGVAALPAHGALPPNCSVCNAPSRHQCGACQLAFCDSCSTERLALCHNCGDKADGVKGCVLGKCFKGNRCTKCDTATCWRCNLLNYCTECPAAFCSTGACSRSLVACDGCQRAHYETATAACAPRFLNICGCGASLCRRCRESPTHAKCRTTKPATCSSCGKAQAKAKLVPCGCPACEACATRVGAACSKCGELVAAVLKLSIS